MNEDFRKSFLYLLQVNYKAISSNLNHLQDHCNTIFNLNFIEQNKYNQYLNNIYILIKNLNTVYNDTINNDLNETNEEINFILKNLDSNKNKLKILDLYNLNYPNKFFFKKTIDDTIKIIDEIGYNNIKDLVKIKFNYDLFLYLPKDIKEIIEEINDITTPLSCNIFEVNEDKDFYWRIPKKFDSNDLLERKRELWIKIPNSINKYIKIELFFKVDHLTSVIKTCQILRPIIYDKKQIVVNKLSNETKIDLKFVKTLVRHDYLGNIYIMNTDEYFKYIFDLYYEYTKLIESTFIFLMKDFISKSENIKEMYKMIFLLLLGSDESIEIACLLIGLLKEKKNNSKFQLYNYLYNNLTYFLQTKIKKSHVNIKNELDKIKNMTFEDVDYKKQLVINKNIPNNIKSLVLEKIEEMKSFNNEYYKQLTYVKTIVNYPWSSDNDDIFFNTLKNNNKKAKEYLTNIEHKLKNLCYGHNEAKQNLLQIIGKWISNPSSQGYSLGLVGPPGVGKTLLAKSVSEALDIPFGQITLGGQNDGEILHGHGYTYSGSQPGMIIKKMVEMGKSRCILYFDELDKACSKHGTLNEITSILIHLTDPNMNKSFQDRFFQGVDFPLNKVIMIFSYNDSSLVDPILLDRIKEIKVSPYTLTDKLNICQDYILPEVIDNIQFNKTIKISNDVLKFIIDKYTNEAGVRNIKRHLEDIILKLNLDKIFNRKLFKNKKTKTINIKEKLVLELLSKPKKCNTLIHKDDAIGIINGLYATSTGEGGIIPIQVYKNLDNSENKFSLKLTGKQGDVMKESVQCSLTAAVEYLKKNHSKYNISDFDKYYAENFGNGFHIHCPSTSTPKDGPSAGGAFTSCFISRILNIPIKNTVGMTGEVELNGNITKIGGLEFKLQGAKTAGVKNVFVPEENLEDVTEIKEKYNDLITKDFCVKTFSNIGEIIDEILVIS
jgi:endopeptidase La